MKPVILVACVIFFSTCSGVQKKKKAYAFSNPFQTDEISRPSFGLKKIEGLIASKKFGENGIDSAMYHSLSLREKFTYNMVHPELFSQICSFIIQNKDGSPKIFGQLPPYIFDEFVWSDRQYTFFRTNRDSVIQYLKECISTDNKAGLNYTSVIVMLNAKEMIPLVIDTYNAAKTDRGLLTVLMLLMKKGKYQPFISSAYYAQLYGGETSNYESFIPFSVETEKAILQQAADFYHSAAK